MSLETLLGRWTYKSLPTIVINKLAPLDESDQQLFAEMYKKQRKDVFSAYFCWIFGAHHLYLGGLKKLPKQLLFWITFGGLILWWLVDGMLMFIRVNEANQDLAIEILRDIRQLS
jgi:hypothetical protein